MKLFNTRTLIFSKSTSLSFIINSLDIFLAHVNRLLRKIYSTSSYNF